MVVIDESAGLRCPSQTIRTSAHTLGPILPKVRPVNFPTTQQTGSLAEQDVTRLFTSWSWTVGRDLIDTGYDLSVEPDSTKFQGHRFLVQVKGTSRRKRGSVVANVSKRRLRQYAVNPLPVFLIRSTAEGAFHWLHVQPWTQQNLRRLKGSGEAGITFPSGQTLDDKDGFLAYLCEILKPAAERPAALSDLARERGRYLSSLDSRLGVRVGVANGAETYEIFARSELATFGVELKTSSDPKDIESLEDALRYGLPARLEVDSFRLVGSDLFSAIEMNNDCRRTLTINRTSTEDCSVCLYPGTNYSMLASEFSLSARLYRGHRGFAISNEAIESIFAFKLRGEVGEDGCGSAQVTMGFRVHELSNAPIQQHVSLGSLGEWARQVLEESAIFIELRLRGSCVRLCAQGDAVAAVRDILYYGFVLGRLHKVAKALNSDLTVGDGFTLSEAEVSDIHLLYALLKGERISINLDSFELVTPTPLTCEPTGAFYAETSMSITLSGQPLGTIPVAIDFNKFTFEALSEPCKYRLTRGNGGSAFLYYSNHDKAETRLTRTKLPGPPIS